VGYFWILKNAQSKHPPNGRKFAQYGHPARNEHFIIYVQLRLPEKKTLFQVNLSSET
jgi:hypothetical protein